VTRTIDLALIPGDGIGPEVVAEALKVLTAALGSDAELTTTEYPYSARHYLETGVILEDGDLAALAKHEAILLGAVGGDPRDPKLAGGIIERGLLLKLRFAFDHYVNLRPTKLLPSVTSPLANPGDVDFVVVREGTEGPYVGNGGALRVGTPAEIATEVSVNTAYGVQRVVKYAFDLASRRRSKVTLVHKTNVLVHAGGLWARAVREEAANHPGVEWDYLHVDAATIFLVTDPARFDVIVTDNLFGDILTDLAGAISGGIGLAASGNINPDGAFPSMFEPVHGSAPDIAGQRKAGGGEEDRGRRDGGPGRTRSDPADDGRGRHCHRRPSGRRLDTNASNGATMTIINLPMATPDLLWQVTKNDAAKSAEARAEVLADPGFGKFFTDHMVDICWSERGGWHRPRVQPYGPISLDPAAAVLHYSQEIFEGLKAYRHSDGSIHTFRPMSNAARLRRSAKRLALPELPEEYFLDSIKQLVAVDADWVPTAPETSLYLRPFMFAKEAFLGVRPAAKVNYYLIASPAGAYFHGGVTPVSIWLSTDYARAGKGGTGAAKTGGNYASSLVAQAEAYENGCDQVLFLDSVEETYLEELGGMNIVLVTKDGTLITPASDSILEGITRDSILQLAEDRGHRVERRPVSLQEWRDGAASGEIVEAFACGTAAVVAPIGVLKGADFEIVHEQPAESVALSLRTQLTDIQYGRGDDTHGWMMRLDS
jgi:branched-chain amino acid aminotransferase